MKLNAQKKIDQVANYLYHEMNLAPEMTDSDHIKAALDAVLFNSYDRSEFINTFQNIKAEYFNAVIAAMWKLDDQEA